MRIFMMADHLGNRGGGWHGGTTYFLHTYPAMQKMGIELSVVFMGPWHPAAEWLEQRGVRPIFLGLSKWAPSFLTRFHSILDATPHDIVHLHSFKSHLAGRWAALRRKRPAIMHVHDHIPVPALMKPLQRHLSRHTSALIGVSESVTRFGARQYGVPLSRCHTIENGLDLEWFAGSSAEHTGDLRAELGLAPERRLIAVIGRVHAVKGQRELLRSLPALIERHPRICLLVVGDGPARGECEQLASQLGINEHVRFLGQRNDVSAILEQVELSVMPSLWEEGFGYAALESMAMRRPVIASDTGGIRTLVTPEQTGLLVPPGDTAALERSIARLLEDAPLRAAMGERARARVAELSIERHVERVAGVYREVLLRAREAGYART